MVIPRQRGHAPLFLQHSVPTATYMPIWSCFYHGLKPNGLKMGTLLVLLLLMYLGTSLLSLS